MYKNDSILVSSEELQLNLESISASGGEVVSVTKEYERMYRIFYKKEITEVDELKEEIHNLKKCNEELNKSKDMYKKSCDMMYMIYSLTHQINFVLPCDSELEERIEKVHKKQCFFNQNVEDKEFVKQIKNMLDSYEREQ